MVWLVDRANSLFRSAQSSPSQPSHFFQIPADHTDASDRERGTLAADKNYFEVRLNELYLTNKRQWFIEHDPMAIALTEYRYAGQSAVVPFVVGPSLIEKIGNKLPQGMVFADTRILGPQPYRGDGMAVTVVLYRLKRDDLLRKLLKVIESTSKAIDFTGATSAYTKVASSVLEGIEEVTGANEAAKAVLGRRQEFSPVECGFYALIDGSIPAPKADSLWVRKRELVIGDSLDNAEPFRAADYLLYSISAIKREDVSGLPFYPAYIQVMEEAQKARRKDIWESAKVKMSSLYSLLHASPDLTRTHAKQLADEWTAEMVALRDRALSLSKLGPGDPGEDQEITADRERSLEILNL
jgi:hypothetical protein